DDERAAEPQSPAELDRGIDLGAGCGGRAILRFARRGVAEKHDLASRQVELLALGFRRRQLGGEVRGGLGGTGRSNRTREAAAFGREGQLVDADEQRLVPPV